MTVSETMPMLAQCNQPNLDERSNCSNQKLFKHLYKELKYPAAAKESAIEGQVVVQFVINKNGYMQNLRLVHDLGGGCGVETMRVIQLLKDNNLKWNPGLQNGKPANVRFTLPVKFKLQ